MNQKTVAFVKSDRSGCISLVISGNDLVVNKLHVLGT